MLICILGVYLLAVWILFYKLKVPVLDLKAKIVVFAIGLGIVASFFFMAQRYAPYTKDVFVQSFVIPMAPQVSGRVRAVHIQEDQAVKSGDPLFEIDAEPYQLAVDSLQAQLLEAKQLSFANYTMLASASENVRQADAEIKQATDNIEALKASLETARASFEKAQAQLELDQANVERAEQLIKTNAVAQQELETRRAAVRVSLAALKEAEQAVAQADTGLLVGRSQLLVADAKRESAVAAVRQIQVRIDPLKTFDEMIQRRVARKAELDSRNESELDAALKEELKELELHTGWLQEHMAGATTATEYLKGQLPRVKSIEAQLKKAEFDLRETIVRAPDDGYVSNLQLTKGAFATAGAPQLSFVEPQESWLVAIVTENGLGLVKPGDAVEVTVALYPGKIFTGKVESIVWGVGQAQGVPDGTLPNVAKTDRTQKYMVRVKLTDEVSELPLRQGSTAVAAIYTQHGRMLHFIRKVQVRIQSILNFLYI